MGGTFSSARTSASLLYDFHYAKVSADPHIDSNVSHLPDGLSGTAHRVSDSGEWETLGSMSLTYDEGEHVVWAIGWAQYWVVPTTGTFDLTANPAEKPRIQFGLRVNGTLIEETGTGTERPDQGAPRGVRPTSPVTGSTPELQHSLDYETSRSTGSMAWHVKFVRVQCQVQVPQGSTTVEMVARRVIPDVLRTSTATPPALYVGNRILCDVVMKLGGNDSNSGQTINVLYPEDADPFDAAHTAGNLQDPVVTAANDLSIDAIRRGGLRHEHLPQQYILSLTGSELTAGSNTVRAYPGWGTGGIVGVGNWDIVNNGAGTNLELSPNDGSGNWDFTNNPGFVLVFANIAFTKAGGTGPSVNAGGAFVPERYGVFGVGVLNADGTTALDDTHQGWVNNPNVSPTWDPNPDNAASISQPCETDVPMFAYFDYRTVPPAKAVDKWRILVSGDNTSRVDWDRSMAYALIFRP